MKTTKISESGFVFDDGALRMPMDRLNAFFADHKGCRITATFEATEPRTTAAQQSYYYKYVVPTIQNALYEIGARMNEKRVDKWLIEQYPGDKSESEIGLGIDVTEARHLNRTQMADFLEWLKQFAAENLSVYIEDPRTI